MAEFNIRSDSVNVEQIMRQIRARIREKRGVDYTEQQIKELAAVKLERFLDPSKVRSELLQQFREGGIAPLPTYGFEENTLFESHRPVLRWLRRLFRPLLMLMFNPHRLTHVLHLQAKINNHQAQYTELFYEIQHNLVLEVTRLGIEAKNLRMRVESLSSRLDFSERRARALESVVEYRPGEVIEERPAGQGAPQGGGQAEGRAEGEPPSSEARRRRRRRRGRRSGAGRIPGGDEAQAGEDRPREFGADDGEAADREDVGAPRGEAAAAPVEPGGPEGAVQQANAGHPGVHDPGDTRGEQ